MIEHEPDDLAAYLREVELNAEEFLQRHKDDKALRASLGRVHALMSLGGLQDAANEALSLIEQTIELDAGSILSACYLEMATISQRDGNEHRVKPYLDLALEAAKDAQNADFIAISLCQKALYYQREGRPKQALDCLALAAEQMSQSTSLRAMFNVFRDSGTVFDKLKLYHKALEASTKAMELSIKLKDIGDQMKCLLDLSAIYTMLADYANAKRIMQEGIEFSTKHHAPISKLKFMFSLTAMQLKQAEYQESLANFRACEAFADDIGFRNPQFLIELNSNLAGCYGFLDRYAEALDCIDKAIGITKDTGNLALMHELNINRANLLVKLGKCKEAEALLKKAISYARKSKSFDMLKVALSNLSVSLENQKDYKKAIKYLRELNRAYQEHLNFVMQKQSLKHEAELTVVLDELDGMKEQYQRNLPASNVLTDSFIGFGATHKEILSTALKAAQHPNASVLITGETGTGKDVLANLIHQNSIRRDALFLPVNMAAISENLMESMFFGHKKGAFTGANQDNKGMFLEANKGSIYLDEISDLPLSLQAKLLRALETGKVTPVGSSKEVPFDTRVICSSNRDLPAMVENGSFRRDLYYRLNTITIHLPPLRDRLQDLEALVLHFARKLSTEMNKKVPQIDQSFYRALRTHSFPGNIRELRNIIEHLVIMHDAELWRDDCLGDLKLKGRSRREKRFSFDTQADEREKSAIIQALQSCHGKQKEAARLLGMSEPTLTRRIKKYKLGIYTRKNAMTQG